MRSAGHPVDRRLQSSTQRGSPTRRRALTLVRDAKVGDGRDAGPGGDDCALCHGQRRLDLIVLWHRQQPDRLSMRGDEVDVRGRDVVATEETQRRLGKDLAELDVDLGQLFGTGRVLGNDAQDPLLDRSGQRNLAVLQIQTSAHEHRHRRRVRPTFRSSKWTGASGVA